VGKAGINTAAIIGVSQRIDIAKINVWKILFIVLIIENPTIR